LDVAGDTYSINEEFKQGALKVADDLDLDELDAARIFLEVQDETDSSGRSAITNAIVRFHQRRKHLLDCLCILFRMSVEDEDDDQPDVKAYVQGIVSQIIQTQAGSPTYIKRCFTSMGDIKTWLKVLAEKLSGAAIINQGQQQDVLETIEYQRVSLVKQHEALATLAFYLAKEKNATSADFENVLETLRLADKYDNLLCKPSSNTNLIGSLS